MNKALKFLWSLEALAVAVFFLSTWYHCTHNVVVYPENQLVGGLIIAFSLLLALLILYKSHLPSLLTFKEFFNQNYSWCVFILIATALLSTQLTALPSWLEERGWLMLAKNISLGNIIHPIRAKSDFPSAFQAWPIGAMVWLGVMPLLASRIMTLALLILYMFYLCKLVQLITRSDKLSWYVAALAIVSKSYILVGLSGWHEVTPVFALVTAQWYYLLRIWIKPSPSAKIALAIFAGFATWTIYTPTLMTFAVGLILLPYIKQILRPENRRAMIVYLMIVAPIIGQAVFTDGTMFARHYNFYLHGGDWVKELVSNVFQRISLFAFATVRTWYRFMPTGNVRALREFDCPHIEISLLLLATGGIAYSIVQWKKFALHLLILPAVLFTIGLLLSTPTEYRITCLLVPTHVFAALACYAVIEQRKLERRPQLRTLLAVALLTFHYFFAVQLLPGMMRKFRAICLEASVGASLSDYLSSLPKYPENIISSHSLIADFVNGLMRYPTEVKNFHNDQSLTVLLNKHVRGVPVMLISEDGKAIPDTTVGILLAKGYREIFSQDVESRRQYKVWIYSNS